MMKEKFVLCTAPIHGRNGSPALDKKSFSSYQINKMTFNEQLLVSNVKVDDTLT